MSEQRSYDPACVGCIYMGWIACYMGCCNYLLMTGKRRPCPPGKDCTVKYKPKKRKKVEHGNPFL